MSSGSTAAVDRLPLPKCSYINTDFPGDDLLFDDDDEPGINAGSARACKARCRQEDACVFWSYREGNSRDTFTRDCFLKEGTPGKEIIILFARSFLLVLRRLTIGAGLLQPSPDFH